MFEEKLSSKKNEVYKRERKLNGKTLYVVEKEISENKRFHTELTLAKLLAGSGVNTPRLLDFSYPSENKNGKLIYEYIDGSIALESLSDKDYAKEVLRQIVKWMEHFYEITSQQLGELWILGDVHLRNFIYSREQKKLYGFDFEEAEKGLAEQDIARLFLFIATYEPQYSELHMELAEFFLNEALNMFDIEKARLIEEIHLEAKHMTVRRNREINTELLIAVVNFLL